MTRAVSIEALLLAAFVLPLGGCGGGKPVGAAGGAVGGAVAGAVIAGPVGAVAGGVAGAAVGAVLTPSETRAVREFAESQPRPSYRVAEEVVVGYQVPRNVALQRIPPQVGLRHSYDYGVVNGRRVIVDPATRRVVDILD
jgi:hypothetical protein